MEEHQNGLVERWLQVMVSYEEDKPILSMGDPAEVTMRIQAEARAFIGFEA